MYFSQSTSFTCCDNAPLGNRNERITTLAKSAHRNQKIEDVQNCFIFSATLSNKERIDIVHTSKIAPILKEPKDSISIPCSSNKLPSDMWSLNLLQNISRKLSEHACMNILVPRNHLNHFPEVVSKSCVWSWLVNVICITILDMTKVEISSLKFESTTIS